MLLTPMFSSVHRTHALCLKFFFSINWGDLWSPGKDGTHGKGERSWNKEGRFGLGGQVSQLEGWN